MITRSILCSVALVGLMQSTISFSSGLAMCGSKNFVSKVLGPVDKLTIEKDNPHMHCYPKGAHMKIADENSDKYRIFFAWDKQFYIDNYEKAKLWAKDKLVPWMEDAQENAKANGFKILNSAPKKLIFHLDLSESPFLSAINDGRHEQALKMLSDGANPDEMLLIKHQGQTAKLNALSVAVLSLDIELVQALIDAGADVHKRSHIVEQDGALKLKRTPLGLAAQHGLTSMVKVLLDAGAKPDSRETVLQPGFISSQS